RRPHPASRQHEYRNDGTTSREAGHGVGESRAARDRLLRSDGLYHSAGALSSFPPRSPCGLFPFLACRMVLLYFLLVVRSGTADSSAPGTKSGKRLGAGRRLAPLPGSRGGLLGRLGAGKVAGG